MAVGESKKSGIKGKNPSRLNVPKNLKLSQKTEKTGKILISVNPGYEIQQIIF